jgi:hypothetical protein
MTGDTTPDERTADVSALENRIARLERAFDRLPDLSRRSALRAGAAALVGGGLAAAATPSAAATTYVETDEIRTPGGATRITLGSPVQINGADLQLSSGDLDASASDKIELPERQSDPTASAGDLWYRTDLD